MEDPSIYLSIYLSPLRSYCLYTYHTHTHTQNTHKNLSIFFCLIFFLNVDLSVSFRIFDSYCFPYFEGGLLDAYMWIIGTLSSSFLFYQNITLFFISYNAFHLKFYFALKLNLLSNFLPIAYNRFLIFYFNFSESFSFTVCLFKLQGIGLACWGRG